MIQVLLAVESRMLRELLRDLVEQEPGIEAVGEVADPVDLLLAVKQTQADVVIQAWPESGEMPGVCSHLLAEYPDLLVIGIPPNHERAYACRQTITRTTLPMVGLGDLLSEIRRKVPAFN